MIWLKRLFFLPRLIQLHARQCVLRVDVDNANKALYEACEMREPKYTLDQKTRAFEALLEELSDVQDQVRKLWGIQ